jgi:homoserine O-succinyltransferase
VHTLYHFTEVQAVFSAYAEQVKNALKNQQAIPTFLEQNIEDFLDNTWRDSAKAVFNNWLGKVYQITNQVAPRHIGQGSQLL